MEMKDLCIALIEGEEYLQASESVGLEYYIGLCGDSAAEARMTAALAFARDFIEAPK